MAIHEAPIVEFTEYGPVSVGTVRGPGVLGAQNVGEFGATVIGYVGDHPGQHLVLNFRNVNYLSSAVLSELLRVKKAVEDGGGMLRLCAIVPNIRKVFEITNLDKVFVIYDEENEERAVKRLQRSLALQAEDAAWVDPAEGG